MSSFLHVNFTAFLCYLNQNSRITAQVRLAMEIFCYRIRKYVGTYLAALGGAEAIIFGGGIGEDTPFVLERICVGFQWCGLTWDSERNQQVINSSGKISSDDSSLHAYVIPVEEGLIIAQEAIHCINSQKNPK